MPCPLRPRQHVPAYCLRGLFLPFGQETGPLCECFAFDVSAYLFLTISRSAETPFVLFALLLLRAPDGSLRRSSYAFDG